jgi:hypothetical protein
MEDCMPVFFNLWRDETAVVVSSELVVISTLLIAGLTVSVSTLRDALVTELADISAAIGSLNQSFSFGGLAGHHGAGLGSSWLDGPDAGDTGPSPIVDPGTPFNSQGIVLGSAALPEN